MSKSLKKNQAPKGTRPISDFFAKKPSSLTPQSSLSTLDSSTSPSGKDTPGAQERVTTSSKDLSSPRIFVPGNSPRKVVQKNASTFKAESLSASETTTNAVTRKARTPDPPSASTRPRSQVVPLKSRKTAFDSDSEQEQLDSVIYIAKSSMVPASRQNTPLPRQPPLTSKENLLLSPSQNRPRKKQRLSSELPNTEDELLLTPKHAIDDWELDMTHRTQVKHEAETNDGFTAKEDGNVPVEMDVDEPQVTEALDPTAKAARIIAEIKARAYAKAQSQIQNVPVLQVREDLSDSDDDDIQILPSSAFTRNSLPTAGKLSIPSGPSTRQSSPSPTTPAEDSIAKNRPRRAPKHPSPISKEPSPISEAPSKPKTKKKSFNPLDALLKEKELEDRKGRGDDALRRAEAAVNRMASRLQNEDFTDLGYLEDDDTHIRINPSGAKDTGSDSEGSGDLVRKRLFGEERAAEIRDLIEGDKARVQDEKAREKVSGIALWIASTDDTSMDVDEISPPISVMSDGVTNHAFRLLLSAINSRDWKQAGMVLSAGALCTMTPEEMSRSLPTLFELALHCEDSSVFSATLQVLTRGWNQKTTGLAFEHVLTLLESLGASQSTLSSVGWPVSGAQSRPKAEQSRQIGVYRLIQLILSAARSQGIARDDLCHFIIAMVLIANDPTTSLTNYRHLINATSALCNMIAPGDVISAEAESGLCTRLLQYTGPLDLVNQAAIISFLASGKGRMLRIARWLAFGLIKDARDVSPNTYSTVPNMAYILEEFHDPSRPQGSPRVGRFEITKATDYIDLAFLVQMLAVIVTDVSEYIVKDRNAGLQGHQSSLALLTKALDMLHSSIADGRAAHITRSRAKAAIKLLSLRIHYQRTAMSKEVGKLDSYWSKGKKK